MKNRNTLVRITTVPISLEKLLGGQMKFMAENGFDVHLVSSECANYRELELKEKSTYNVVNMTRTISPIQDCISLIKMIVLMIKLKPSIVHTHTPKAGLIGMVASKIIGVPIRLHTVAGLPLMEATGLKRKVLNIVEKITYLCATMVYPNSNNLKRFIISENFCKEGKLRVIGSGSSNGINVEDFKHSDEITAGKEILQKKYGILEDDFVFVFVGRLVKDKGVEELAKAFAKLPNSHNKVKLVLVGPQEPDLDPLSDECLVEIETNKNIIAPGYQSDVRPFLAMGSALVFPSYREGFPNVPMQAGCFNLPSVVTNINGCNEIIIEGKNGLIIPVKDTEALHSAMETLYLDKDLYAKMAENARDMVTERYDQKIIWELILGEYKMHLSSNGLV